MVVVLAGVDFGVVLPQLEIGADPETIRNYAQTVESLGFTHLQAYDHVVGANSDRPGFEGPYDYRDPFHEPFTLYSHLASVTESLTFLTGILILPQRQTALVAKQAAEVDILSNGRLQLGVGVGWNDGEYEALGMDFHTRGRRLEEQIGVLRELWQNELVTFNGEFHNIGDVGIKPMPIQRPIPIHMGGGADIVLRRTARLADGWLPPGKWRQPDQSLGELEPILDRLREYTRDVGRDPNDLSIIGRLTLGTQSPDEWIDRVRSWRDLGATHLAIDTMNMGLEMPRDHLDTITRFKTRVDEASDLGG